MEEELQKQVEENLENYDDDLYDEDGNFDELAAHIKSKLLYELDQDYLNCPNLEDNVLFSRLKQRLLKFHVIREKYKFNGPTEA